MTLPAEETYRIHLPQFDGPFDLLLFFIERDELDIHDIPIARVTKDFLTYLHALQEMNIELAAEFILVAGTLMRIKARMLLPRPELNEQGQEVDPRQELVQRLLEYKRYKEVIAQIVQLEEEQARRQLRGNVLNEEKEVIPPAGVEEELYGLDLYSLMRTFKRVWEKHHDKLQKPRHVIRKYPYTVDEVKSRLMDLVQRSHRIDFVSVVLEEGDRIYAVFCFLSILELVQLQRIRIVIGEGFNNFWIERKEDSEEEETLPEAPAAEEDLAWNHNPDEEESAAPEE